MPRILKITAAKDASNVTIFDLVDSDGNAVNLTALGASKVTVEICGSLASATIDSDSDDVSFSGSTVNVRFGALGVPASKQPYYPKISYEAPTSKEEIIAGRGFETSIVLTMIC